MKDKPKKASEENKQDDRDRCFLILYIILLVISIGGIGAIYLLLALVGLASE